MADTIINTLYPPIIETYQPAFVCTEKVPVTFSLSDFNSIKEINKVHVSIVDQRNNSNVLKSSLAPQQQSQNDNEDSSQYYRIINGILIAEIPIFEQQNETQQIGLFQYDPINDIYAINLDPNWLNRDGVSEGSGYWNNNQYYQVQIRFDKNSDDLSSVSSDYLLTKRAEFSEWSSITLIKPILKPNIEINKLSTETNASNYIQIGDFDIIGHISFEEKIADGISVPETERLQAYRIIIDTTESESETVFDSKWVFAKQNLLTAEKTSIQYLLDFSDFTSDSDYILRVYCRTNNGYIWHNNYNITLRNEQKESITVSRWNNKEGKLGADDIFVNQEDGIAEICFQATRQDGQDDLRGIFYFRRARWKAKDTPAEKWELIYRYEYTGGDIKIEFTDSTIGSLYTYQYRVQFYDTRSNTWEKIHTSNPIYPEFYDMILSRQDKQIAIRYNGQITSWKPIVNRQKIDTLGGRYPKFVENAVMNYKTFQISGLISAEEDFNRQFLNETTAKYRYDIEQYHGHFGSTLLIRNDTDADGEITYPNENQIHGLVQTWETEIDEETEEQIQKPVYQTIDGKNVYSNGSSFSGQLDEQHDSYPHNHWFWERTFREELVAWLNDGEPKLYRSMPEGNIIVMLTDINLTPNTQLSRMLYNFSATMYEVGDGHSLEQLYNLGVIDIPRVESVFINGTFANGNISDENRIKNIGTIKNAVGQSIVSSNEALGSLITNSKESSKVYIGESYNTLWDAMSLEDRLNEYYNNRTVKAADGTIKIIGGDLQFTSPPQYFELSDDNVFQWSKNNTSWLGYVFNISFTEDQKDEQQIFVNQKGYYHIPSNMSIKRLSIPNVGDENRTIPQTVNMVYKYTYNEISSRENVPGDPTILNSDLIGQYTTLDSLALGENIISIIEDNYKQNIYDTNNINKKVIGQRRIYPIKGLSLEITPYTYLKYSYIQENTSFPLIVGETGVFDNFQNWELSSLILYGRRLSAVPSEYPYHIEEWNYFKDTHVLQNSLPITPEGNIIVPTIPNIITINNQQYQDINAQWQKIIESNWDYTTKGFLTPDHLISEIGAPNINTVYTFTKSIVNGTPEFYYQIYYIDGQWYPVIFLSQSTILAAVPIYGMVNYNGELIEEVYQNV